MSASPSRPRFLALEALTTAHRIYAMIGQADALAINGDKPGAISMLRDIAEIAAGEIPVVRGVIRAQEQAAKALDLAKGPRLVCGAFADVPNPHPDPANPQVVSPDQTGPNVA